MPAAGSVRVTVDLTDTNPLDLTTGVARHLLDYVNTLTDGTGDNQIQHIWSDTRSVTSGVPDTIDIRGGITNAFGVSLNIVNVVGFAVRNRSTTTGQNFTVGGGSNPFITWLIATGDGVRVGPGGVFIVHSPIDPYGTTAGTADIVTITAASGTISYDIVIWGTN